MACFLLQDLRIGVSKHNANGIKIIAIQTRLLTVATKTSWEQLVVVLIAVLQPHLGFVLVVVGE
jgi:hypothetical protein